MNFIDKYRNQKKNNDKLKSKAKNYFFQGIISFIFGTIIIFTMEGSISYFLLNSIFILSFILAIYLIFKSVKTIFQLGYKDFCPKCNGEAEYKIIHSEYIDTTPKRKDGHHDLRYKETGYNKNTYNYVCIDCEWQSFTSPKPDEL